jgi:hypothetical protein
MLRLVFRKVVFRGHAAFQRILLQKEESLAKSSPTLARNKTARVGHPEAFWRIEGRPPAVYTVYLDGVLFGIAARILRFP